MPRTTRRSTSTRRAVEETVVYEDAGCRRRGNLSLRDLEQVEGAAAAVEPDEAVAAEEVEVAA